MILSPELFGMMTLLLYGCFEARHLQLIKKGIQYFTHKK